MSIIQAFLGQVQGTNGALPTGCYEHERQSDGIKFKSYTDIERRSFSSGFVGNYVSDIGKILKLEKILTSTGASGLFHRYEIEYINKNGVGGSGPNGGTVSTYDVSVLVEEAVMVTKYQTGFSSTNASCVIPQSIGINGGYISNLTVEVLLCGGGGGSHGECFNFPDPEVFALASAASGGGGGGALSIRRNRILDTGTNWTVSVGGGGSGDSNGSASSFTGSSTIGGDGPINPRPGGGFGGNSFATGSFSGGNGGSGGGGAGPGSGGTGSEGNPGGNGSTDSSTYFYGGGGGGRQSAGGSAIKNAAFDGAGNGGAGWFLSWFIGPGNTSTGTVLANGGGGGASSSPRAGSPQGSAPAGSGSGAGGQGAGGPFSNNGGSGRIVIRYPGSTQYATGGTVTTGVTAPVSGDGTDLSITGTFTIHDFTASGTFTVN